MLSERLECRHIDTDDIFWLPSTPPFSQRRESSERFRLLSAIFAEHDAWVLSGSLTGWGDPLIPLFDLVVFLNVEPALRMARLRTRERERYGDAAVVPGGPMHERSRSFLDWTARYDHAGLSCPPFKMQA